MKKKGAPSLEVLFEDRNEFVRKGEVKDVDFTAFSRNLELFTTKGDRPGPLSIFAEVFVKLHLAHVALAVGNVGPELEHEREPGLYG